jgi:acyl dehydratase
MSQMNWIDGTAMGLLGVSWEFQAPVMLGDTISADVTPLEARPSKTAGRGVLTLGFEVLNQREEVVQKGSIVLLIKCRPGGST